MTSYTANVLNSTSSVNVKAWVLDSHATVKVNNTAVDSGEATGEIVLNEGNNAIVVDVTSQDGTTKRYTVSVSRAPAAPVGLLAVPDDGMVTLNWQSLPSSVSYSVYGGTASRSYGETPIATVSGSTESYVVTGLTNGTSYYFTVMANGIGGGSLYSNEVLATPLSGNSTLTSLNLTELR